MAKKGVKKVMKAEKMSVLKASCLYKSSQTQHAVRQQIIEPMMNVAGELSTRIHRLDLEQVVTMKNELDELTRSSDTSIAEIIAPYLVPDLVALKQSINHMKEQIKNAEVQLDAVHSAVGVAFAEAYYGEAQYDYTSFYKDIDDRIDNLKDARARAERAELERQLEEARSGNNTMSDV